MKQIKATPGMFGAGRFSPQMESLYESACNLFSMTEAQADKFARQAAADAGDVLRNASASFKVGKANKDGKASITDASKMKGVHLTNALNIVRAIQWAEEAGKNGVSYGFTEWKLTPELQKYVDGLIESKPVNKTPADKSSVPA